MCVFLEVVVVYVCSCLLLFMCLLSSFKLLHLQSKHIQQTCNKQKRLRETHTIKLKYIIFQPEPARYLFVVGSWAGHPVFLDVVFFLEYVALCLFLVVFVLCICLVLLSVCLKTTQHTTLHTNKHDMGLLMACVKCSTQCSNSLQVT